MSGKRLTDDRGNHFSYCDLSMSGIGKHTGAGLQIYFNTLKWYVAELLRYSLCLSSRCLLAPRLLPLIECSIERHRARVQQVRSAAAAAARTPSAAVAVISRPLSDTRTVSSALLSNLHSNLTCHYVVFLCKALS